MCRYCNDGEFPCEDYEYWEESESSEWDLEGSNNQPQLKYSQETLSELSLEQLEKTIMEKEIMARDQYGYKIPYYGYPRTYQDKIKILEQRLNSLIDFLKARGVIDKAYIQKDAKETVLDSIRQELSKQEWSKHVSKEYFEEQVRLEGIRRSLKTPHKSMIIEKTMLSEGMALDEFIESSLKEGKCPFCNITSSRSELINHMEHRHTDQYEKWMDYISMVIKMKDSTSQHGQPTSEHPQVMEEIYESDREKFEHYKATMSKEDLCKLSPEDQEILSKYPDITFDQLDRLKRLRRSK